MNLIRDFLAQKNIEYTCNSLSDFQAFITLKMMDDSINIIEDSDYSDLISNLIQFYQNDMKNRLGYIKNYNVLKDISSRISRKKYRKTLCILCYDCSVLGKWDPDWVDTGIPGSEECVIYLSKYMAKLGYDVTVEANADDNSIWSNLHSNPRFVNKNLDVKYDILVAWRRYESSQFKHRADKVYVWLHDSPHYNLKFIENVNGAFVLTKYHEQVHKRHLKVPSIICGNGVELDQFQNPMTIDNQYSCGYFSNYGRGLEILLDIWPDIKIKYPQATLSIYYGRNTYGAVDKETSDRIIKKLEALSDLDVYEKGCIGHKQLADEMSKLSLWLYPCNTYGETFCITAIKAQCAGMIPVTTRVGALAETVCDEAYTIDHVFNEENIQKYKNMVLDVMSNVYFEVIRGKRLECIKFARQFSWEKCAKIWDETFNDEKDSIEPQNKPITIKMVNPTHNHRNLLIAMFFHNNSDSIGKCLEHIYNLDYPKNKILFYFKCFQSSDYTTQILLDWINKNNHCYKNITLDRQDNEFNVSNLIDEKNKSIRHAIDNECDYFYVLPNCLLSANVVNTLYEVDFPIVAPLLKTRNTLYSNYNLETDSNGYFTDKSGCYNKLLQQEIKGIIEVKAIKYCYLIDMDYLEMCIADKVNLKYEYMNFGDHLRLYDIKYYLDNRTIGGYLFEN